MLLPDPRLPSLREAWSPPEMAQLLNERVLPLLRPGAVASGLTVLSIAYRPLRSCVVLYEPHIEGQAEPVWLLATFAKAGKMERAFRKHYQDPEDKSCAVLLPEHASLIELFPADHELPGLPAALDADAMAAELSISRPAIEVLHYVPHRRCLVRYAAEGVDLVGKLYAPGSGASRAWALLSGLDAAQREAGHRVTPRPVAFVEKRDLVVMERAPGAPLDGLLAAAPDGETRATVDVAATTLASLNALDVDIGEERSIARELAHTRKRNERLRLVEPTLAGEVDIVLDRVEPRVRAARAETACLVHGDFKASQLLIDGDRAVVVDFDHAARGDPALDVGNFLADLHRQPIASGREELRALGTDFLEAYRAHAHVPGLVERARLAQIVALARMAVRALLHAPHEYVASPSTSLCARLLREAQDCLGEL